jgi:carbon monoxide dehydrogenase subunit G
MDMNGEYQIAAPRQRVWEALNDPEMLRQCIPGCEEIVKVSDVEWTAKVTAKVGPVKAKFAGKVTLSDLDPPNGYTITGEGTGGAAGFAKGGAAVKLVDQGAGTLLTYTVKAQVGGKLAQIGSRLIDGTARKLAEEFFSAFAALLSGPGGAAAAAVDDLPPPPIQSQEAAGLAVDIRGDVAADIPGDIPVAIPPGAPPLDPPPGAVPARAGLPPLIWVAGLIIVVTIVLLIATR